MQMRSLIAGTAAMSTARALRLAAQFLAIPLLARLLSPAEYGLMAIAMPFVLLAMMLADAGIGTSLVRTPMGERRIWSTCFWLTVLLGLALALVMAALGPLAAWVFDAPPLAPMLLVLAFVVLAQAVHLIPVAALQQSERFGTIALVEIAATVAGIGTAVWLAYHGYGVWALVGQQVAFFAVRVIAITTLSPFRPTRVFVWREVREHLVFGRDVLGANLLTHCARSLDNWLIGKVLGATLLGFYAMAFQFARLPAMLVTAPLQFVAYPQLVRLKENKTEMAAQFLRLTRVLAWLVIPPMALAAAWHAPLFALLLSDKWQMAGLVFMLLAPAAALQAVTSVGDTATLALGRADIQLRNTAEFSALWILALAVTVRYGLYPAAITYSACYLLYLIRYLSRVLPLMEISFARYLRALTAPLALTAIIVFVSIQILS